jgi:hypothetical protein
MYCIVSAQQLALMQAHCKRASTRPAQPCAGILALDWHQSSSSTPFQPHIFTKHSFSAMPSRKRGRKSRKPPTDPQLSSSKPSSAITPTGADRQDLSELVASGAGLDTKLGQLALQSRLDVTQAHIVVSDLGRKGHTYQRPTVKGHARAHFGDVYNVNQSSAHVPADSGGSDLMGALSFDGMSDRLTSVTPAYAETCRWVLDRPEYLRW